MNFDLVEINILVPKYVNVKFRGHLIN